MGNFARFIKWTLGWDEQILELNWPNQEHSVQRKQMLHVTDENKLLQLKECSSLSQNAAGAYREIPTPARRKVSSMSLIVELSSTCRSIPCSIHNSPRTRSNSTSQQDNSWGIPYRSSALVLAAHLGCCCCCTASVPGEGRTALGEDSQPEGIRLAGRRKGHIRGRVVAAGNHRMPAGDILGEAAAADRTWRREMIVWDKEKTEIGRKWEAVMSHRSKWVKRWKEDERWGWWRWEVKRGRGKS